MLKHASLFAFLSMIPFGSVHATTPPALPATLPVQIARRRPLPHPPSRPLGHIPTTRDEVMRLNLSPTVTRAVIAYMESIGKFDTPASATSAVSAQTYDANNHSIQHTPTFPASTSASRSFIPRATVLTAQTTNATFADNVPKEVAEPTTIVQRLGGVDHTIVAYIHYQHPSTAQPVVKIATSTDSTTWRVHDLPWPASSGVPFAASGDPVLVENPYNAGDNPNTVFCVASVWAYQSGYIGENTITVWASTNGGESWNVYGEAWNNEADRQEFADKPAAAISWSPASLGHLYVTFANQPDVDGWATFLITLVPSVPADGNYPWDMIGAVAFNSTILHSPQIVVDPSQGDLYLAYLDWTNSRISILRNSVGCGWCEPTYSFDSGQAWASPLEGQLITNSSPPPAGNNIVDDANIKIEAVSLLVARFNASDGSVGVVYHRRKATPSNHNMIASEVVFNRFYAPPLNTGTPSWQTQLGTVVNANAEHYTWDGAIDYDEAGNSIITYYDYDHSINPQHIQYQLWSTRFSPTYTRLDERQVASGDRGDSDPRAVYSPAYGPWVLGEYLGLWYWYGKWHASSVYVRPFATFSDPGAGNIWESIISP